MHVGWFWLLAACRGDWRYSAVVSSIWHSVSGRRLRQQQCGSTRFTADCDGWLSYAAVTPAWFIVERWCKRQLWFAAMTAEATCMCCAMSCCWPTGAVWLFDEDLGNRASLFIILTVIQYTDPWHGVLRRTWQGPRVRCLQCGDESEEVFDGGRGETPACCVFS